MISKDMLTEARRKVYECDAATITFYRRNPCIAAADLLGIQLVDSQKYVLQCSWNAPHVIWCCCRNFGKSFLGAVFMILKAILYENQAIYIVAPVGKQSKETFEKIEEIALRLGRTASSIKSLTDILEKETVKSHNNKTGFRHLPESWEVNFYNGSSIMTLNGKPDNARSRRATMVFFDEAAFCSDELIQICEAFATQNTDFATSTDKDYDADLDKRRCPTQLVYASSQGEQTSIFYARYREFAKKMLAGDNRYFIADMICDVAINVHMNGKPYKPLLTRSKVDTALRGDEMTALREYYNRPIVDGGVNQIIRWGTIRRNETFYLPETQWNNGQYVFAFDPARTNDNSIFTVMRIEKDPDVGYVGKIVNCVNFVDTATKKKIKLDSNRQLEEIHNLINIYNGPAPDYENVMAFMLDAGAGGGGTSTYADNLLNNWTDSNGRLRRGFIDASNPLYEGYERLYPDAVDKLRLISPKKYRTQMVDEFIELMNLGVIQFPADSSSPDSVTLLETDANGEERSYIYNLSTEEQIAMANIKMMKREITSIYKFENTDKTTKTYALSKEVENKMHDDRFYTAILLAHFLYELRRGSVLSASKPKKNYLDLFTVRRPRLY